MALAKDLDLVGSPVRAVIVSPRLFLFLDLFRLGLQIVENLVHDDLTGSFALLSRLRPLKSRS